MPRNPSTGARPAKPRFRRLRAAGVCLLLLAAFMCVNNTTLLTRDSGEPPLILAHRGMSQTFDMTDLDSDTCTAERILPPAHDYLENTIPGMKAAFSAGADQVELDLQPTSDDRFAVFHDWELDCRTEGSGRTRDHTLAELQRLDVGYGYTADGGETYPFRGRGEGMMPSLDEVLETFESEPLLLHVKSEDPAEGRLLAERLSELDDRRLSDITVYGGDEPIAALSEKLPELRVMSKELMLDCLGWYEGTGWFGVIPPSCRHTQLHVPESYGPLLWGWSGRFVERMASVDTRVVLVAGGGEYSEGFDTVASLDRIPAGFGGTVWTNSVEVVADRIKG